MKTINFINTEKQFKEVNEVISKFCGQWVNHEVGRKLESDFQGKIGQLINMLNNFELPLDEYGHAIEGHKYILELTPDFCTASFSFAFYYEKPGEKRKLDFHGGLICHGLNNETFTVSLNPNDNDLPYWAIHT